MLDAPDNSLLEFLDFRLVLQLLLPPRLRFLVASTVLARILELLIVRTISARQADLKDLLDVIHYLLSLVSHRLNLNLLRLDLLEKVLVADLQFAQVLSNR